MRIQLFLTGLLLCAPQAFAATLGDEKACTDEPKTTCSSLTAEEETKITALFEKLVSADLGEAVACTKVCYEKGCMDDCIGALSPKRMAKVLKKEPAFALLAPVMVARFHEANTPKNERARIVDFLANTPTESAAVLGNKMFQRSPEVFAEDHLLSFAENGCKVFGKEVAGRAKSSPRAAAFLALRGKDSGREVLLGATKKCLSGATCSKGLTGGYVAATGLAALGEKKHLKAVKMRMHDDVLAALDRGDFEGARRLALEAEFLTDSFSGKWQRLSYLEGRMQWHVAKRTPEVKDADQVFEIIEAATPISG